MISLPRARDIGLSHIWSINTGPKNSIIDVDGVLVGHVTLIEGSGKLVPGYGPVRTGVTVVIPHPGNIFREKVPAAIHVINGFTKAIGLIQIEELGLIESPIALTNTLNVGLVADRIIEYSIEKNPDIGTLTSTINSIVLECNDGYLNDIQGRYVKQHHVKEAIERANSDVMEGSIGAGTDTIAFGFKGGIGTSSRKVDIGIETYIVGVLAQTNFGRKEDLIIAGIPIGKYLHRKGIEMYVKGSVNVIIATNAPLTPRQLKRLAKRASNGLAKVGSYTYNGSGEVVLTYSTAHRIPHDVERKLSVKMILDKYLNPLFRAVVEATEEAILNSMFMARTMDGRDGHVVYSIPINEVINILKRHEAI